MLQIQYQGKKNSKIQMNVEKLKLLMWYNKLCYILTNGDKSI